MKATLPWLGALLFVAVTVPPAKANPPYYPCYRPQAPDACGPGFYCTNPYGAVYGPNYYVRPPFEPFNGFRPSPSSLQQQQQQGGDCSFPVHPFARSPRDFFMQMD
jgi:hypothetical protein